MPARRLDYGTEAQRYFQQATQDINRYKDEPDGVICPCCAKLHVNRGRSINCTMAAELCKMHEANLRHPDPIHMPTLLFGKKGRGGGDYTKLRYWGLLEGYTDSEGRHKSGFYCVTEKGHQFARGEVMVPRKVYDYRGKMRGYVDENDLISIHDCFGENFDLAKTKLTAAEAARIHGLDYTPVDIEEDPEEPAEKNQDPAIEPWGDLYDDD